MKIREIITEISKVTVSHDPNELGATVYDKGNKEEKTVMLPITKISIFEPISKFDNPQYKKNLHNIIKHLRAGNDIPPILVRKVGPVKYQVIDGHHRLEAYKQLGMKTIPAKIVSKINIHDINNTED